MTEEKLDEDLKEEELEDDKKEEEVVAETIDGKFNQNLICTVSNYKISVGWVELEKD